VEAKYQEDHVENEDVHTHDFRRPRHNGHERDNLAARYDEKVHETVEEDAKVRVQPKHIDTNKGSLFVDELVALKVDQFPKCDINSLIWLKPNGEKFA
jgi:hypothetical protein